MIRGLRNISLNLWLATLLAIPLSFFVISGLQPFFMDFSPVICSAIVFLLCIMSVGLLTHMIAVKMIARLLAEGEAWERTGVMFRAGKAYIRAVRVFDTFVFRPFSANKMTRDICGAIARFSAAMTKVDTCFDLATTTYLELNPEDEDIALIWLKRIRKNDQITPEQESVLSRIVSHHYRKLLFSEVLADIFIKHERKDFAAKKIFNHMTESKAFRQKYADRIDPVIGRPESTLGAMLHDVAEQPDQPVKGKEKTGFAEALIRVVKTWLKAAWGLGAATGRYCGHVVQAVKKWFDRLRHSSRAKRFLKNGFLALVFVWLGYFMLNTISHLFKTRAVTKPPVKEVALEVPKPFTIQVAAYLKHEHAQRYVGSLKTKGIDARIKKVDGGGKSWYLVRVSEFVDKKSAAEYGNKLKKEKIIDDFFVNNK